jgi:hypothetical protein
MASVLVEIDSYRRNLDFMVFGGLRIRKAVAAAIQLPP